ncbi:molybdopterin-dependent oxidoreductase [Arcanobacterium hippocoleae]
MRARLIFASPDGTHPEKIANDYVGADGAAGMKLGFAAGPVGNAEADVEGKPFASYFSGNVIQICPVGALTSAAYRFRARPFDLVSVPSVTEHDASGAALRIDYRRGSIVRRLAGEDAEVNEDWITDKDRFAFRWQNGPDRLRYPRVANEDSISWFAAIEAAAQGLRKAKNVGVITGGRLTLEDAYAYSKFARVVLGTNNIDFRTNAVSDEETQFLGSAVAGRGLGVTYQDIENAGHVLLIGLEAEDECGSLFLRLRKGALAKTTSVTVISAYKTLGTAKMFARFLPAAPGSEVAALAAIHADAAGEKGAVFADLQKTGAVILVGERAADTPGALSAALNLAERTGAKLAWVPRRAGARGSVDAGLLPTLLPGGRQTADSEARIDTAAVWGVDSLPAQPGLDTSLMLAAAAAGELDALILAGVELSDLPANAAQALEKAFVVQLEVRESEIARYADVLLPVAPPAEKGGTFVNWEGRMRPFGQVLTSTHLPDRRVLNDLAQELGFDLGLETLEAAVNEYAQLREWDGARTAAPAFDPAAAQEVNTENIVLATWKQMLDGGALQLHEPFLANTARKPVAVMSHQTAAAHGIGANVVITGPAGSLEFAVAEHDMLDGVVWVPQNAVGLALSRIGLRAGDSIKIANAEVTK